MAAAASAASSSGSPPVEKTADEVALELAIAEKELSRPQRLAQKVYECGLPADLVPDAEKESLQREIIAEIQEHGAHGRCVG
jgi:hypothetical protein